MAAKPSKRELLEDVRTWLEDKDKADKITKRVAAARLAILAGMNEPGIADRIDANGSRFLALPFKPGTELKVERRVARSVDLEQMVEVLDATKEGRRFVQVVVTGGRSLLAFLKKHGWADFTVTKSVTEGDVLDAVKEGVLSDEQVASLTKEKESLVLRTVDAHEEEAQDE